MFPGKEPLFTQMAYDIEKMIKIVGFQIKIYYVVNVLLCSETVQNTSNLFKEFIGRTFKYEFLLRTPPGRAFCTPWKS